VLELRCASLREGATVGEVEAKRDNVEKEAIQVAAVAIRILEDGDSSFPEYMPPARSGG